LYILVRDSKRSQGNFMNKNNLYARVREKDIYDHFLMGRKWKLKFVENNNI
jgi:hypothetical protein